MTTALDARGEIERIGRLRDDAIDPVETALLVSAASRPGLDLSRYRRHLDKIVTAVAGYVAGPPDETGLGLRIEALVQVVVRRYGYGGSEGIELDPEGADLTRVVDSRNGLSEAIALIYLKVARDLGWEAAPLSLPGRVMVRLEADGERRILDPAGGGRQMDPRSLREIVKAFGGIEEEIRPGGIEELGNRDLVGRLIQQRKTLLLRDKRLEEALGLTRVALLLSPGSPTLWREYGLLHARLDHVRDAVAALEEFLRLGGAEEARYNTSILLQELRSRLT